MLKATPGTSFSACHTWLLEMFESLAVQYLTLPLQRRPSAIYRPSTTGWATIRPGRSKATRIGSGLVERAVAIVINARMKKRGMRWKRNNATAAALRVQRINADGEAAA